MARRPTPRYKRYILQTLVGGLWGSLLVGVLGMWLLFYAIVVNAYGWFGAMPGFEQYENPDITHASLLYSSDGELLGKYYRTNRTLVGYENLSEPLRKTLLATEDRRFFEHSGIDLRGLLRATFGMLTFNYQGGGSTLTMQLAENLYKTSTKNKGILYTRDPYMGRLITKFKEWIIAIKLERNFTKEELMAMYLNTIPFGSNAFGIDAAAKTFFGCTPDEISYEEAAVLVGLINAPTRYSPVLNPDRALLKRNEILHKTYDYGAIDQADYDSLRQLPIRLSYEVDSHDRGIATYFRSVLRNYLMRWCVERGYDLFGEGLRIYTTIDARLQRHAEQAVSAHMQELQAQFEAHLEGANPWIDEAGNEIPNYLETVIRRTDVYKRLVANYGPDAEAAAEYPDSVALRNPKLWEALTEKRPMRVFSWSGEQDTLFSYMDSLAYYKRFLRAGFMAMAPRTGAIRAWVGGINYKHFKFDHVMQGKRQPGSTIKPFVYATVIDNGFSPCYEVVDQPVTFHLPDQYPSTWSPQNADGPPSGRKMTIRQGMARSVNTITAYWMQRMGAENVVAYAKRIGIKSKLDPVPALCLGAGGDVSVFELGGAYATFANKGFWTEPLFLERIEDKDGNVLQSFVPQKVEALSEETAYVMLHMLKGTLEERGGTAAGIPWDLRKDNEIGAKTGTTQNASDGWFVGMTQELVGCAWVGGEDRSIHFRNWVVGQGARTAMPIWISFMRRVYADPKTTIRRGPFDRPQHALKTALDCDLHHQSDNKDSLAVEDRITPDGIF